MDFASGFDDLEKIYNQQLATINNMKFTLREIDVLACIMHSRGEKKIAALLSISPRTISAHVYNIMGKISCNSKDQIIDFVENSHKVSILREYYLHLLIRAYFEKLLTKIAATTRKVIDCYSLQDDSFDKSIYQSIQKHLKQAGVNLIETTAINSATDAASLFDLQAISAQNYYRDLLRQLEIIIKNQVNNEAIISDISKDFEDYYTKIQSAYNGKSNDLVNMDNGGNSKVWYFRKNYLLFIIGLVILFIMAFFIIFPQTNNEKQVTKSLEIAPAQIVNDLEQFLAIIKSENFSANNISEEFAKKNHSLVKKIEKLLDYQHVQAVQDYFLKTEMSSEFLVNYLYNLQALASYYMYNMHDGTKAQNILEQGKELAERYVNSRGKVIGDFEHMSHAEILSELQIVDALPQIYTRIIYSLGRSYIYTSLSNASLAAKKYFELAKYLGLQLNLFEGYLSDIGGLLIIEKEEALRKLALGDIDGAKRGIIKVIKTYEKLRDDNRQYILDYNPSTKEQKYTIPSDQAYSYFECCNKMLASYNILLSITQSRNEIKEYMAKILTLLTGSKSTKGMLRIIANEEKLPQKKLASFYNTIGDTIITTWQIATEKNINIDSGLLRQALTDIAPSSPDTDDLDLAEILYSNARDISRSTDFTKAAAYQGLAKVYSAKLAATDANSTMQRAEFERKIQQAHAKSVLINQQLNRSISASP